VIEGFSIWIENSLEKFVGTSSVMLAIIIVDGNGKQVLIIIIVCIIKVK
jgi:hypothetical protein